MKTIGVLGGMGPQATMAFEQQLHRVSQALVPPHFGTGYPPMVVWYHRHPPAVLDETGAFRMPPEPHPRLLEGARWLGQVADFLVVTSNGVHKMWGALEEAAGRPLLSMIDVTLAEVQRRGWRRVGVLCMGGRRCTRSPWKRVESPGKASPLSGKRS
ncbi:aspartate/glutamate racemase family protein [Deinococcus apachensis]|uniref:aspartate/glutamate racemase family protein n=1 Tax=Deinococcus apachensis TaxID=309886 RepID=UPI00039E43A1|nr:aspartate/glutamate racemase family protein [Deinococcus apachensis]